MTFCDLQDLFLFPACAGVIPETESIYKRYGTFPHSPVTMDGCTVHNYNDGDLIACFDENIPDSVIKTIAKKQPLRAVFRDSGFASSPSKINVGEIFKMLAPDIRVKVI